MELRSRSRSKTPFLTEMEENFITTRSRKSAKFTSTTSTVTTKSRKSAVEKLARTSDYSSEEGDEYNIKHLSENDKNQIIEDARKAANGNNEISALGLYRHSGRYWDKYPKTDWTYSRHSRDRVEIAPGVVQMPNMSRRTIHSNYSNKYTNTGEEEEEDENESHLYAERMNYNNYEIRKKLFTSNNNEFDNYTTTTTTITKSFFRSFLLLITTFFYYCYEKLHSSSLWITKKIYLFVIRILLFDTWLLRKKWNTEKNIKGILLLCLLPLLLFGGWWLLSSGLDNSIYRIFTPIPPIKQETLNNKVIDNIKNDDNNKETIIIKEIVKPVNYEEIARNLNREQLKIISHYLNIDNIINTEKIVEKLLKSENFIKMITINYNTIIKQYQKESNNNNEEKLKNLQEQIDKLNNEVNSLRQDKMEHEKHDLDLNNLTEYIDKKFSNLLGETKSLIMKEIIQSDVEISDEKIKSIVDKKIKIYDADKTGLADYAMEPMGGQVVTTRCTETYQAGTAVLSIMGIPLWYRSNTPRVVIRPGTNPGECWPFQNFPGFLVIKLACRIRISAFSLEHVSKLLVPLEKFDSAPKDFEVWGLQAEDDKEPIKLGDYFYDIDGDELQFFPVQSSKDLTFEMIELRINSNHGNPNYTCLYRFRVHGNVI